MRPPLLQVGGHTRHPSASMIVLDPGRRLVLLVHQRISGQWQFPGGHLEIDESADEAAVREVREETGVIATVAWHCHAPVPGMRQRPVPWRVYECPAPAKPDRPGKPAEPAHTHLDSLFIGTADAAAAPVGEQSEVIDARWFPVEELAQVQQVRGDAPPLARQALEALLLQMQPFVVSRPRP